MKEEFNFNRIGKRMPYTAPGRLFRRHRNECMGDYKG